MAGFRGGGGLPPSKWISRLLLFDWLERGACGPGVAAAEIVQRHHGSAFRLDLQKLDSALASANVSVGEDLAGRSGGRAFDGTGTGQAQGKKFIAVGVAQARAAAGPGEQAADSARQFVSAAGKIEQGGLAVKLWRNRRQRFIL